MASSNEKAIAIIPARGGSKGIPRKNVRLLAGRPLIAWTIDAARAAQSIERVIVSTNDAEIAEVAREHGAEIVFRPAELASDSASSESALLHALDEVERAGGILPRVMAFLQCTSPLTIPQDIDGTIAALTEKSADSSFTAAPFHHFLWWFNGEDSCGINHDKRSRPLRQQRRPEYIETGAVYAMRTSGFRAARHRFFGKTVMHVVPPDRSIEIDDPRDLVVAEAMMRWRQESDRRQLLPSSVAAIVFDFDGVFTDDSVCIDQHGVESVVCRRDDGMGIQRLAAIGLPMLVLSGEANPVVAARCQKLGIECIHGVGAKIRRMDKKDVLAQWLARRGISPSQVVYVGNDRNDVNCLRWVGCGVAVADAKPAALEAAKIVLSRGGGQGAVREICDMVIDAIGSAKERIVA